MSKKARHLDFDEFDDAGMFADDFDIDEFLGEQERPFVSRRERRRQMTRRRIEELRDRHWLSDDNIDWEDYL